jgi:RecA-family ATPase
MSSSTVPPALPVWMQQPTAASVTVPSNKEVALELAGLGIRIFPCNSEKHPIVKAWEEVATCDLQSVDGWGQSSVPAIPPGVQGLVVIDCDRKAGGADGVAAFHALCRDKGIDLHSAFAVDTPSSGRHYYFTTAIGYGNSHSFPAGIDVRGRGGFVIAPGSTLPDGRGYRIVSGTWATIPALPVALAAYLKERRPVAPPQSIQSGVDQGSIVQTAMPVTERDLAWAASALAGEVEKVLNATPGERNNTLNRCACTLGGYIANGSLQRDDVEQGLLRASIDNGSAAQYGIEQQQKTVRSGIEAGMQKPYPTLAERSAPLVDIAGIMAMGSTPQTKHKRNVALLSGSAITEQPISWLWQDYLPSGKLTLLAGAGGTGKSTIAFSLAATITVAGAWPDGTQCKQLGNVLIWSSEDDPADTIKPRLMAMGADSSRYFVIAGTRDENGITTPFDPARDMDLLRETVQEIGGVSLLIIDPIVSAISGDMHKANDVRRSLQTIVDFAGEQHCAVLGITHFAKGTAGKKSDERVIGSQAFAAFARMVLVAAKEEDSDRRVFTRAKSNNSLDTGGYSYCIEPLVIRPGLIATRVAWGESLEGSSRSILAEVEEEQTDDDSVFGKAKQLLMNLLATKSMYASEVEQAAKELSISPRTLRRAREALKIVKEREKGFHAKVRWSLPSDPNVIAQIGGAPIGQRAGGIPWEQVQ